MHLLISSASLHYQKSAQTLDLLLQSLFTCHFSLSARVPPILLAHVLTSKVTSFCCLKLFLELRSLYVSPRSFCVAPLHLNENSFQIFFSPFQIVSSWKAETDEYIHHYIPSALNKTRHSVSSMALCNLVPEF